MIYMFENGTKKNMKKMFGIVFEKLNQREASNGRGGVAMQ